MLDEPDAVARAVEGPSGTRHRRRVHRKDHRRSTPRPNSGRGGDIARKMDMMPTHPQQPVAQDRRDELLGRAVVKRGRRRRLLKLQIDRHAMALLDADQRAGGVEGEALLVVARYDLD